MLEGKYGFLRNMLPSSLPNVYFRVHALISKTVLNLTLDPLQKHGFMVEGWTG